MPSDNRGAVIHPTARILIIWGHHLPAHTPLKTRDGAPLAVMTFPHNLNGSIVDTITNNLQWDDPDFPITIIEAPSD